MNRVDEIVSELLSAVNFSIYYPNFDDISDIEDFYFTSLDEQKCSAHALAQFLKIYPQKELEAKLNPIIDEMKKLSSVTHEECQKIYGAQYLFEVINIELMARKFEEKYFQQLVIKGPYLGWIPVV